MNVFHLAWRELKNRRKFVFFFLINLSIGLIGLMSIEHFKISFNDVLNARSKTMLGADIGLRSRQKISEDELNVFTSALPPGSESSEIISLFSMVSTTGEARLVSLRAIEENFPFYGGLKLRQAGEISYAKNQEARLSGYNVWIYPELEIQMGLKIGDQIKIGNDLFTVADVVDEDSQQTFQEGAMAPRVYLSLETLEQLGLTGFGSRFTQRFYYKFPSDLSSDEIEVLAQDINTKLTDPALRVVTPKSSSEQVGRTLNYLNDFLGLVSLVALFLASVGLFYLFRGHLESRKLDMAILSSLGLSREKILKIYLAQIIILSLLGTLLASLFCALVFPLLSLLINQILPLSLPAYSGVRPFALGLTVGVLGNILLVLPLLIPLLKLRPQIVFQQLENNDLSKIPQLLAWASPWILFYWALSIVTANSVIIGSSFIGVFFAIIVIVFPIGSFLLGKVETSTSAWFLNLPLSLRLSLRTLSRFKLSTLSLFVSLVLGTMLLNLVPQIEKNLQNEISGPNEGRLPSLFLFDIQEEQIGDLKEFFEQKQVELRGLTPMISSRLLSINDVPFVKDQSEAKTREEEQEMRIRNRGINLTFRKFLDDSETIIEGRHFLDVFDWNKPDSVAEVTVERRYAKRLGMELGDRLNFEVLGQEIPAKIVGIREVRWTSFMPNFFIVFQSGVLDDAPKTFLAVVPKLDPETRALLQRDLAQKFGNISMIDISELIVRIMSIMQQMAIALSFMAALSLVVGLFVLYSLVQHQMRSREKDITLLKIVGMNHGPLSKMVLMEFSLLSLGAGFFGALASLASTFIFAHLFFDGIWTFDPWTPLWTVSLIFFLCLSVSYLASLKALRKSPQILLQETA